LKTRFSVPTLPWFVPASATFTTFASSANIPPPNFNLGHVNGASTAATCRSFADAECTHTSTPTFPYVKRSPAVMYHFMFWAVAWSEPS